MHVLTPCRDELTCNEHATTERAVPFPSDALQARYTSRLCMLHMRMPLYAAHACDARESNRGHEQQHRSATADQRSTAADGYRTDAARGGRDAADAAEARRELGSVAGDSADSASGSAGEGADSASGTFALPRAR